MSVRSLQCVTFFTLATNHYYGRIVTLLLKSYVVLIFIYILFENSATVLSGIQLCGVHTMTTNVKGSFSVKGNNI